MSSPESVHGSRRIPKAMLLDLDNTVYAYAPCHRAGLAAAQVVAATYDQRWEMVANFLDDYAAARNTVKDRLRRQAASHCRLHYFKAQVEIRFGCSNIEASIRLHEAYWQAYFLTMTIDPGCLDFLNEVRSLGLRLAWVTNLTTERQMLKLRALGLDTIGEFLVTSEEAGAEKPDPIGINMALNCLKVSPKQAWFVGDDLENDIEPAQSCQLTSVWLRRDNQKMITGTAPDYTVRDWFELRQLLLESKQF